LFTMVIASLACSVAGIRAALQRKNCEAALWFVLVFALPLNVRPLDLLRVNNLKNLIQLALCITLAGLLAACLSQFGSKTLRPIVLVVPVLAIALAPTISSVQHYRKIDQKPIDEIADWAEKNTWGSSMFLFPDAGRALYPGIFRAESRRPVWVDWNSGSLGNYFESFAKEWWERWQQTMEGPFSSQRLEGMLLLPVDYYVLKRENHLADVKPVFGNAEFVVYDSGDLRRLTTPLHLARSPSSN
jgi:hypothetical protein